MILGIMVGDALRPYQAVDAGLLRFDWLAGQRMFLEHVRMPARGLRG